MKKLNIIGCGKVGIALASLWREHKCFAIGDVLNRSEKSAAAAVQLIGEGRAIATQMQMRPAELFLLGTPDDVLVEACELLSTSNILRAGDVVFHCSGALASREFESAVSAGAQVASVHPIRSFTTIDTTPNAFVDTFCGVEGSDQALYCRISKQGRGRQNRKWFSPFGAGISCSIFKHLPKNTNPIGLSLYLGISIIDALGEIGFQGIQLKWPNDLYYKDKKLGGILVDIYQNSDLESVISVGMGINYCLPNNKNFNYDTKESPIDLCSIVKDETIDRSIVTGHLLKRVSENLNSFNENSLKNGQQRWKDIDYLYDQTITIEVIDKQITGINRGITSDGELILEVDSKRIKIITGHIVG